MLAVISADFLPVGTTILKLRASYFQIPGDRMTESGIRCCHICGIPFGFFVMINGAIGFRILLPQHTQWVILSTSSKEISNAG
jgi:hypothetical protein